MDYDFLLDEVYSRLCSLTDGEEDEEMKEYNEFLLDGLQNCISYIHFLEKRVPKKNYDLKEINELNNKYR